MGICILYTAHGVDCLFSPFLPVYFCHRFTLRRSLEGVIRKKIKESRCMIPDFFFPKQQFSSSFPLRINKPTPPPSFFKVEKKLERKRNKKCYKIREIHLFSHQLTTNASSAVCNRCPGGNCYKTGTCRSSSFSLRSRNAWCGKNVWTFSFLSPDWNF